MSSTVVKLGHYFPNGCRTVSVGDVVKGEDPSGVDYAPWGVVMAGVCPGSIWDMTLGEATNVLSIARGAAQGAIAHLLGGSSLLGNAALVIGPIPDTVASDWAAAVADFGEDRAGEATNGTSAGAVSGVLVQIPVTGPWLVIGTQFGQYPRVVPE
jgi:hypothetical protein